MAAVLIVGTIVSAITFLILHPRLDKELANRFAYLGIGGGLATVAGFMIRFVSSSSVPVYTVFQVVFLCLGVLHVVLLYRFHLLGSEFAESVLFTTLLTVTLVFVAALGFNLITAGALREANRMCVTCVLPLAIPFFVFQSYRQWRLLPQGQRPLVHYTPNSELPTDESEKTVTLSFFIPSKYTGLRGVKGIFTRSFPGNWTISQAFHETISMLSSRDSRVLLDEHHRTDLRKPADWILFRRSGLFWEEYLDPSQILEDREEKADCVIRVKRLRKAQDA